jgi:hypothetical protein
VQHHRKINKGALMVRIIARTDPSERHDAPDEPIYPVHLDSDHNIAKRAKEAGMFGARLLTQRQIRCIERLPDGHKVVSVRDGVPIVRQQGGQLSRMQPNGRLVVTPRVEAVQSYLHVHG